MYLKFLNSKPSIVKLIVGFVVFSTILCLFIFRYYNTNILNNILGDFARITGFSIFDDVAKTDFILNKNLYNKLKNLEGNRLYITGATITTDYNDGTFSLYASKISHTDEKNYSLEDMSAKYEDNRNKIEFFADIAFFNKNNNKLHIVDDVLINWNNYFISTRNIIFNMNKKIIYTNNMVNLKYKSLDFYSDNIKIDYNEQKIELSGGIKATFTIK